MAKEKEGKKVNIFNRSGRNKVYISDRQMCSNKTAESWSMTILITSLEGMNAPEFI